MGGFLEKIPLGVVATMFSFVVYLLPLPGHGGFVLLGAALFLEGPPGSGIEVTPMWLAAMAVTLLLQALSGGLFYWFLLRPGWRRALVLPVGGVAIVVLGIVMLFLVIPALVLGR